MDLEARGAKQQPAASHPCKAMVGNLETMAAAAGVFGAGVPVVEMAEARVPAAATAAATDLSLVELL